MKKYTVLFCEDNKICFQGIEGIVDPKEVLKGGGRIFDFSGEKKELIMHPGKTPDEYITVEHIEFQLIK